MNTTNNPGLTGWAKALRTQMTKEERRLWYDYLKGLPVTVNRQKVIGPYIADFYCAKAKGVIEIDGSPHYEDGAMEADAERDAYFRGLGMRVLRYSNREVHQNFSGVCEAIGRLVLAVGDGDGSSDGDMGNTSSDG